MYQPILLSDEDDISAFSTPLPIHFKKRRTESETHLDPISNHTVFVLDDDPTPQKRVPSSSPSSFVPGTPLSEFSNSEIAIVKCTKGASDPQFRVSHSEHKFSGITGLICLESDNESESESVKRKGKESDMIGADIDVARNLEMGSGFAESICFLGNTNQVQPSRNAPLYPISQQFDISQVDIPDEENVKVGLKDNNMQAKGRVVNAEKKDDTDEKTRKNKMTKEERMHVMEEKRRRKEQEKLQKAALKAEAAELKKIQKEKQKWEKGKLAVKSIVAEIDAKVVELGSVGGHLLTRFAEKGLTFRITSNPIERSIVWTMNVPEHISQISSEGIEIQYIILVYEADEFCNLVLNESLLDHVSTVRSLYPSHTICYLTNKLMAFINKREQENYKNPISSGSWKRPPVEELLAKLTTHFVKVHSRQCVDEAELAEHVVGLTCSLASCQFRKKLTRLSVNANGSIVPKDFVDRDMIKKSLWLKALVAIPKVQPRFAIAIWKRYPTMKSLLSVYMDPSKSVHEKEFLLKDLTTEVLLGEDRRLGEICSKRVYRVVMAQSGCIKTDDVEDGADFFRPNPLP